LPRSFAIFRRVNEIVKAQGVVGCAMFSAGAGNSA
jgi:hypothetical protein